MLQIGQAKGDPRRPWTDWRAPPGRLIGIMRRIRRTPTRYRRRMQWQAPGWLLALIDGPDHERQPWEP